MSDAGKRETQFRKSALTGDGLENSGRNGGALAIDGASRLARSGSARAAESDASSAKGSAASYREHSVQVGKDIVELAAEEEPQVVSVIVLARERYPRSGQLQLDRPNVLGIADLEAMRK